MAALSPSPHSSVFLPPRARGTPPGKEIFGVMGGGGGSKGEGLRRVRRVHAWTRTQNPTVRNVSDQLTRTAARGHSSSEGVAPPRTDVPCMSSTWLSPRAVRYACGRHCARHLSLAPPPKWHQTFTGRVEHCHDKCAQNHRIPDQSRLSKFSDYAGGANVALRHHRIASLPAMITILCLHRKSRSPMPSTSMGKTIFFISSL